MEDKIEIVGQGSTIQHGKLNDRIYLIKLRKEDCPDILNILSEIARENNYSKVFCKVPGWAAPYFFSDGYLTEGYIPKFYNNREPAFFLAKYLSSDRLLGVENDSLTELGILLGKELTDSKPRKKRSLKVKTRKLTGSDVEQITEIYRKVFLSYPFPIHNPGYIHKTMKENVYYFGMEHKGKLIAVASAEVDKKGGNAEMTDFATLPNFRGMKLSQKLLSKMEKEMKPLGIYTLYTIARLNSMPMNKTFLNQKYNYAGTLIRNTNISGKIESMNVYYKHI